LQQVEVAYGRSSGPPAPYSLQCAMCRSEKRHSATDLGVVRADQDQHPPPAILPVPGLFLINPSGQQGRLLRRSWVYPQHATRYIFSPRSFICALVALLHLSQLITAHELQEILALR